VECKLRYVKYRRVSDSGRVFRLAFRVTGISDHWYRSTMVVIGISLGTPCSTGANFRYTWEHFRCTWKHVWGTWKHLEAPATGLGEPMPNLGVPKRSLGALVTSLGAPQIAVELSGKNNILFGNTAGGHGNHSYYLSFNNF
jgi:hypothetical protein